MLDKIFEMQTELNDLCVCQKQAKGQIGARPDHAEDH